MEKNKEVIGKGGEVKTFAEIYGKTAFDFKGRRAEFDEMVGKEIIIEDFARLSGAYGDFLVVQATIVETREQLSFPVGSEVVIDQIKKAKEDGNIPIKAKIEKRTGQETKRRYFTLA